MNAINEKHELRYKTLGIFFATFALLIIGQMVRIQVSPQAQIFRKQGDMNAGEWKTITPSRGLIYDRWGHVLASNQIAYEVGVELKDVRNPETIALTVSSVLGKPYPDLLAATSQTYSLEPGKMKVYAVLARGVTEEQKQQIQRFADEIVSQPARRSKDTVAPSMRGLVFQQYLQRTYPEKEVASNVIGFVNEQKDGFGVEKKFNELLSGTPVNVWVPLDPNRVSELPVVPDGASLVLTLDREIQIAMEKLLDNSLEETGAEAGTIVVMDPRSGEIMAMASTPRMDLNQYGNYKQIFSGSTPFNKAVSQAYEPGSVFKVLTMAAALDSGAVETDTVFVDPGVIEVGGVRIYNWNSGAWGPQTMLGCMQHSLNVCLAWTATELGANRFYSYMDAFGFGRLTGIELAGEDPGRLKMPGDSDWYMADLATNSFGQGISATPVQMLMAVSAVANEGKMVAPHIVRSMVNNGHQYNTPPQVVGTPINAQTARDLSNLLSESLEEESSDALVQGYRVAGKTGTAEIPTPYGYSSNLTNASFVGWGPVDDPRFLVYVWLEKPQTSQWGSVVAAPVFSKAVERIVVLMNLPPDQVRLQMNITNSQ